MADAASNLPAESEASRSYPTSVALRDGGVLRRHTLTWLSQLASRRSVHSLSTPGDIKLPFVHGAAWRVFCNKVRVFWSFAKVDSGRRRTSRDLETIATQLSNPPTFANLFRTEGLGYYTAMTEVRRQNDMTGLLDLGRRVPERSFVPFYLGVGMALALDNLPKASRDVDNGRLHQTFTDIHTWCRDNAAPGLARVVFEPLGFAAVNYRCHLISRIDEMVRQIESDLSDSFWHGVGRGLYFAPSSFFPPRNLGWHSLAAARQLAANADSRAHCVAGLSFAATLVNIWQPRPVEYLLAWRDKNLNDSAAMASGISAAAILWHGWSRGTAGTACVEELCAHKPRIDGTSVEDWNRLVTIPCRRALRHTYARMAASGDFGDLFRYRRDAAGSPECRC